MNAQYRSRARAFDEARQGRRQALLTHTLIATSTILALALSGCGGDSDAAEGSGEPAGATGAAGQASQAPPPAPAPAIPQGTRLSFEVVEEVSTASHSSGDRFSLRLVDEVHGEHGARIAPGAEGRGTVTESQRSSDAETEALLAVRLTSVQANGRQHDIRSTVESIDIETATGASGQRSAATVATGAAAGAIIGQILGRDTRSTVAGAAVGAAAGAGVALTTREGHAVLPQGTRVVVRLDEPLVLH
jgi:hypothetical protein